MISRRAWGWLVLLVFARCAGAAHPFVTDDPITQGRGNFELQLGTQFTRTAENGVTLSEFHFAPQLSYGVLETARRFAGSEKTPKVRGKDP